MMTIDNVTILDAKIDDVELRRIMAHIEAHPKLWKQNKWRSITTCGTAYCFAGWKCELDGVEWAVSAYDTYSDRIIVRDGDLTSLTTIERYAARTLGISHTEIDYDGIPLFWPHNTLRDLHRMVNDLCIRAELARAAIRAGNIGEPVREVTFEPLPDETEAPVQEPAIPAEAPVTVPA